MTTPSDVLTTAQPRDLPPLLERDGALAAWSAVLGDAVTHGRCVALVGEPGVGKSRLCDSAAAVAAEHGFVVLRASGGELEQGYPWSIARQLLERAARERGSRLLEGHATLAAGLLLPAAGEQSTEVGEPDMVHALLWALANASEDGPLALVVDDVQWADEPSLAWLQYVVRRLHDIPVAILFASRPHAGARVEQLLAGLDRLDVDTLSPAAIHQLLATWAWPGAEVSDAFVAAATAATGGNPFLVCELARALVARGVLPDDAGAARLRDETPERIAAWIGRRLDALSPEAMRLARAAAVVPQGTTLPPMARVAGLEPTDALAVLPDLVRAGILAEDVDPPAFVHPLVRTATHERIEPAERAGMHRCAADVLAAVGAPADVVAAQLLATPPVGDRTTVDRLRSGAERVLERGGPDQAARMLERAIVEGCELDDLERVQLHRRLGEVLARVGSPDVARWFDSAFDLEPDPLRRAQDAASLGRALFAQARFGDAIDAFGRGRRVLHDAGIDGEHELELAAGWASAVVFTPAMGDPQVREQVERLVRRSTAPTTVAQRVALGHMAGLEMLMSGRPQVARDMASTAWGDGAMLRDAGPDEPALWAVTAAAYGLGDLELVFEVTDAVAATATLVGAPIPAATASCIRSFALLQRGDLAGALAESERALHVGDSLGAARYWETFLPAALSVSAHALLQFGELERARALLTLSPEREQAWGDVLVYLPMLEARGAVELAAGNPAAALDQFRAYSAHCRRLVGRDINPAYTGGWRWGAVEALVQLDRRDEALELAREELQEAEAWGQPRAVARARRMVGRALGRHGVEELDAAAASFGEHGYLVDEAWALHDAGVTLRASGRRADARERLRRALDLADRIEARLLADRARAELVVLGARPRRDRTSGARSLTATERRVAGMAAQGLSNREIAERLFVTLHAIRFHLRNAYAKLQVTQREELGAALAEDDPAGD